MQIEAGKGYWIQMTDPAVLTLDGNTVANDSIPLKPGWNLAGYNYLSALSPEEALSSITGNYNSVWTYDVVHDEWKKYIVGVPGFLNNLDTMEPGKGYWIDVATVNCTWDVSGSIQAAPASPPVAVESRKSHVSPDRPGIPHTIWGSVEDNGVKMTKRSDVVIVLKVDNKIRSSYRLGEVAQYGDYYVLDVPEVASTVQRIELYVQSEDTVTKAASISPGKPGQTMRLDLHIQTTNLKVSLLHQNYPNPFNPDTWIPYELAEGSDVQIAIYSLTGQPIRMLDLGYRQPGFYTRRESAAHWDGRNEIGEEVASGVYFYTIRTGNFSATRKMTVLQ